MWWLSDGCVTWNYGGGFAEILDFWLLPCRAGQEVAGKGGLLKAFAGRVGYVRLKDGKSFVALAFGWDVGAVAMRCYGITNRPLAHHKSGKPPGALSRLNKALHAVVLGAPAFNTSAAGFAALVGRSGSPAKLMISFSTRHMSPACITFTVNSRAAILSKKPQKCKATA